MPASWAGVDAGSAARHPAYVGRVPPKADPPAETRTTAYNPRPTTSYRP